MSNDLTTKEEQYEELRTVIYEVDGQEVKLSPKIVQKYIVGEQAITEQEYKFFVELCKARNLNPFLKEAYLIKFKKDTPAQLVVGKDAILKKAIRHPKFDGREQGIIIQTESGEVVERKGTFKLKTETLVGGWAKAYRKDWSRPVEITVSFDEVAQRKNDGSLNSNWANKSATMVEKVALVRALRECFCEELGGMIDEDEVWEEKDLSKSRVNQDEVIEQKEPEFTDVIEGAVEEVGLNDL